MNIKESKNSDLFYFKGIYENKFQKRTNPVEYNKFKIFLIENHKYCNDNNFENVNKTMQYYDKYKEIFYTNFPKRGIKISVLLKFNPSKFSLNYYIDRGYSHEKSNELIKINNNQTSLDSFIRKYGEDIGHLKFIEYVNKWKASIAKHDKKELYKNFIKTNTVEYYTNKINPNTNSNYTIEEAEEILYLNRSKGFKTIWKEVKCGLRKNVFSNNIQKFLDKGLSYDEAKQLVKERATTFKLEKLIQKYGLEEGTEKWKKRQIKWQKTLNDKSEEEKSRILLSKIRNFPRVSKESIDFFTILMLKLNEENINIDKYKIFYGLDNEMILYNKELKRPYFYDFSIPELKLIIEYNGSTFHPNFDKLTGNDINKWKCPFLNIDAYEKRKLDETKIEFAKSLGYDVLIVWDFDEFNMKLNNCKNNIISKIKTK